MLIIFDEWLIHDLRGDNGESKRKETLTFLEKMYDRCDKLVILEGSPFVQKFYKLLMKDNRVHIRSISRYLRNYFLLNSDKCVKLSVAQELPEELKDRIPHEDRYLYQIRQTIKQGIIVTTDEELRSLPNTYLRDEFLKEYN